MVKRTLLTTILVGAIASAQAVTIATHADPAQNNSTPLFTTSASAVTGNWSGTGLTLDVPVAGMTFTDVQMDMGAVTRAGSALGAGTVKFFTTDINAPIFQVDFTSGTIFEPFGLGASFVSAQDATFSGSAVTGMSFENEQFAFSFANPVSLGQGVNTYTASFTSSADVVPEPASMAILGLGIAALARRKRK
jgi:hypothetical protein